MQNSGRSGSWNWEEPAREEGSNVGVFLLRLVRSKPTNRPYFSVAQAIGSSVFGYKFGSHSPETKIPKDGINQPE